MRANELLRGLGHYQPVKIKVSRFEREREYSSIVNFSHLFLPSTRIPLKTKVLSPRETCRYSISLEIQARE